jgi:hypothetical protein
MFAKAVGRLGIRHRFASALNLYATARLERFWRTLKDTASLRLHRPATIQDLERRLEIATGHYVLFRPHQGLCGATPAEAFLGAQPACGKALSPPRGRHGEGLARKIAPDSAPADRSQFPLRLSPRSHGRPTPSEWWDWRGGLEHGPAAGSEPVGWVGPWGPTSPHPRPAGSCRPRSPAPCGGR